MLEKGPKTKQEMISFWGVFKFDPVFSCFFGLCERRGGLGGGVAKRPQKMKEEM